MKSDAVKKGLQQAPHRSLFNALGMTEEEMERPLVGIVCSYNEIVPGHMNLDKIANAVKMGVAMAGGTPIMFPAIAVCDGIAMGHEGMKYSLVTRDLIADSTECMAKAHQFDALVMIPNCDKNVPGLLMAAARLNIPTIFVSGGPMLAGRRVDGKQTCLSSLFEAVGQFNSGKITEEKLKEIEEKENVKIIYCVESGSRAWGFASPDSDYDVRFIYVRNKEDYLKLNKNRDVIEWRLDDVLDINGWDIQKALRLLYKSNPTLFEWSMSPIVYKTTPQWEKISGIVSQYFLEKTGVYHYLSMAKGNYREYLKTDEVKLKKYFYVIRPILACKWILDKKTAPPMLFSELMNECLDDELKPEINRLLEIKKQTSELGKGKRIDVINDYIEKELAEIEKKADIIENKYNDWEILNKIFLEILEQ